VLAKPNAAIASELVRDLAEMIESAQKQVASVANVALTALHWQIGHHVRTRVLEGQRAAYGAQIPRWTPKSGHQWTPENRPPHVAR